MGDGDSGRWHVWVRLGRGGGSPCGPDIDLHFAVLASPEQHASKVVAGSAGQHGRSLSHQPVPLALPLPRELDLHPHHLTQRCEKDARVAPSSPC